jgi:DNA-binding NarL/FixJ family response regulator
LEEALDMRLDRYLMYSSYGAARALTALEDLDRASAFDTVAYHYHSILPGNIFGIHFEEEVAADRLAEIRERSKIVEPKLVLERLLSELAIAPSPPEHEGSQTVHPRTDLLTDREVEILQRVSNGMSNRDIAEELFLSTGTVKWYLSQIYGKLGVSSRTQAIARARELRFISQ